MSCVQRLADTVATNCNGRAKGVLSFTELPEHSALWHFRCPEPGEFSGQLPELRARAMTTHWFDACELSAADARSELKAEHRTRQGGGGWEQTPSARAARKRSGE